MGSSAGYGTGRGALSIGFRLPGDRQSVNQAVAGPPIMRYQALILMALVVASFGSHAQSPGESNSETGSPETASGGLGVSGSASADKSQTVRSGDTASVLPSEKPTAGVQLGDVRASTEQADDPRLAARDHEPRIANLDIKIEGQQILLSFNLLNAFGDTLKKRIDSGLYSGFLFEFELVRDRKSWFNKNLDSGTVQVVAMYNAVTREYLINVRHDGDLIGSRMVQDVDDLESALTEFENMAIFSIEGVQPRQRLRIRVRAKLGTRTVFFFIPNTVHTDWAESERFRLSELE